DPAGFKAAVNSLTPQGRTPLTAAVRQAAEQLNYTTRSARIVLVSDGVENCDGDPAALATALSENALDLTVHVIGFDVSGIADQSGLEALATLNHGLYLTPETSQELKDDLNSMMEMPTEGATDSAMSSDMMAATLMAPDTTAPRSRITVEFTGPMDSGDYIGLSQAGADDVLAIARAGNSGTALLIAPRATGSYELRYYTEKSEVLALHMIEVK
ncbi:MAG: VWA domain-containing protein, partial [Rhodobacteraceae bacterium]|nr:VWA domain-containing protein [Paracoccaceae bacterium]